MTQSLCQLNIYILLIFNRYYIKIDILIKDFMNIHVPKVKIKQPDGIKYMIQEYHYSKDLAQEYIDMLISKSLVYIERKKKGEPVATLMTVEKLEVQLNNIKKFEILEL